MSVAMRERDRQKVRKCVLGECRFCCLFSQLNVWIYFQGPSHDFYYLYFGSEKAVGVINWCISLFLPLSVLSPPLSLMFSETHFEHHQSQTLPPIPSAPHLAGFLVLLRIPWLQNVLGITLSLVSSNMLCKCLLRCLFSLLDYEFLSGRSRVLLTCGCCCC